MKKEITTKDAKEVWEEIKDNEFTLIFYPTFGDYWKECERINNLPDDQWHKLMECAKEIIANCYENQNNSG